MKRKFLLSLFVLSFLSSGFVPGLFAEDSARKAAFAADSNGYKYEYVANDPFKARIYTLPNGLKVYLSRNDRVPRVFSMTGVRAGAKDEPADATGLAHYFEHMMFKGTEKIGSLDWNKEKPMLDKIEGLFEQRRAETDQKKKDEIYKEIDRLSGEAAKLAVAGEYDKIITSLGGNVNAFTSHDMTGYYADIPANELDKLLLLESERVFNPRLRLFHTELETVFEEFNMGQDSDRRQAYKTLFKALFQTHPYSRDVIGLPEHIKNPSMKRISEFVKEYYVPSNMVFAIVGDIDYDKTIKKIDELFGKIPAGKAPAPKTVREKPIAKPVVMEVSGPEAASVLMAFRFERDQRNSDMVLLVSRLLTDRGAGIMDQDLVRAQKVISASCGPWFMSDHIIDVFSGVPRNGQSLEDVKSLMLRELDKIKKGDFEDWRLKAIVDNLRVDEAKMVDDNEDVAHSYVDCFVKGVPYEDDLNQTARLSKISKADVVAFANANYKDNYAVVFKRVGPPKERTKVAKPAITPVELNRDKHSQFYKDFMALPPSPPVEPVFLNFSRDMDKTRIASGLRYFHIANKRNDLFSLHYVAKEGKMNDIRLPLAFGYLSYLGTSSMSADQLRQEFYKLAIDFGAWSSDEFSVARVSGIREKLPDAVRLLDSLIRDARPDKAAYDKYVDGIIKKREDSKKDRWQIGACMRSFGWYGPDNPAKYIIPEAELRKTDPAALAALVKDCLTNLKRDVVYWGPDDKDASARVIFGDKPPAERLRRPSEPKKFIPPEVVKPRVFVLHYDAVQSLVYDTARGSMFDTEKAPFVRVFNEYFGMGLTSVMFQEIREARGLAYMAGSVYAQSGEKGKYDLLFSILSTQQDKLADAIGAMNAILADMPRSEPQFLAAKEAVLKDIRSQRILGADIYFQYLAAKKMGISYDLRRDVYDTVGDMSFDKLDKFFKREVAGKKGNLMIVGNLNTLDAKPLEKFGEVRRLTLEEVFGY